MKDYINCSCTDCGGPRQKGPCSYELIIKKTIKSSFECNCTDCGGPRQKGKCFLDKSDVTINKISYF